MARKKKSKTHPYIKIGLIAAVTAGLVWFIADKTVHAFRQMDYFNVQTVVVDPVLQFIEKRDLESIWGKNIFEVDLKAVQRRLSRKYPQASELRLIRRYPNQIAVVAKRRLPFAQLFTGSQYAVVDDGAVVLSFEDDLNDELPLINGVQVNASKLVPGLPVRSAKVRVALRTVDQFLNEDNLKSHSIRGIDVENLSQIIFKLSNDLDVIIDRDSTAHKIKVLGVVLAQDSLNVREVKYIDLRFKEPIIGKK